MAGSTATAVNEAFSADVFAGTSATTARTATPATAVPPGLERVTAAGLTAICRPVDRAWIVQALLKIDRSTAPSATAPSTSDRPAEAHATTKTAENATELRSTGPAARADELFKQINRDLPRVSPRQSDELVRSLNANFDAPPPVARPVFLVVTADDVRQALLNGWTDDNISIDKSTGRIRVRGDGDAIGDNPLAESTFLHLVDPASPPEQRAVQLANFCSSVGAKITDVAIRRRATTAIQITAKFVAETGLNDLPAGEDQVWFRDGLAGALAVSYMAAFCDVSENTLVAALVTTRGPTPVAAATIDLLDPTPASSLKDEYVGPYNDAYKRKAVAVCYRWLTQVKTEKLQATLTAVRRVQPADGATLVAVIKEISDVDLTVNLRGRAVVR